MSVEAAVSNVAGGCYADVFFAANPLIALKIPLAFIKALLAKSDLETLPYFCYKVHICILV